MKILLSMVLPPSRTDIDCRAIFESIQRVGQTVPIVVRHRHNGYKVMDGHKRVKAMKELGHTHIEAEVID